MRIPDARSLVWLDGKRMPAAQASIGISDLALVAGFGLFETLAVRDGSLLDVAEHLARLLRGAERLGLPAPDLVGLKRQLALAAREIGASAGWAKVIVTGGGRSIVCAGTMDGAEEGRSVSAVLLPWRRNPKDPLNELKTLSYAANVLGLKEAERRGADEGIWLNTHGHLAEACSSNLFVVDRGKLHTAATQDGCLAGVVRALTLRAARDLGVQVHVGKLRLLRLERAREAFLTSSLGGVRPLTVFDRRPVGTGQPGPLTLRLAEEVARLRRGPAAEPPAPDPDDISVIDTGRAGSEVDSKAERSAGQDG